MRQRGTGGRQWFWATLALSSITIVAVVFALWELVENRFFRYDDYVKLHYLYISRGIASSLILSFWAAWYVLRLRLRVEKELRRSRERYRGLMEAFPGAVVLLDAHLRVCEWNAAAERLYGLAKADVLGSRIPTIPPEKESELAEFLERVRRGELVLDVETQRRDKSGMIFDAQLSLLPFHEAAGRDFFLEVTADIRERVRLRKTLLELEKLTSMGKMAAGTAHHLNTPLTAMLLRVQMMRERNGNGGDPDLDKLESGIHYCHQFVQRLLDFTRFTPAERRPQEVKGSIESVVSFLTPAVLARHAHISLDLAAAAGKQVHADQNFIEALFLILISNALDAIDPDKGRIAVECSELGEDRMEIRVKDNGCGIAREHQARIFEPFFTTKEPGKGTGLGLAIARNTVQEHGGAIRLESEPGRGATVVIELPLHMEPALVGGRV